MLVLSFHINGRCFLSRFHERYPTRSWSTYLGTSCVVLASVRAPCHLGGDPFCRTVLWYSPRSFMARTPAEHAAKPREAFFFKAHVCTCRSIGQGLGLGLGLVCGYLHKTCAKRPAIIRCSTILQIGSPTTFGSRTPWTPRGSTVHTSAHAPTQYSWRPHFPLNHEGA